METEIFECEKKIDQFQISIYQTNRSIKTDKELGKSVHKKRGFGSPEANPLWGIEILRYEATLEAQTNLDAIDGP